MIRELDDGLVLRRASADDAEALADFNARIHADHEREEDLLRIWTRDLLERPHPTMIPDDFLIVEEPASGKIVSSLNYIPQTWTYDGIALPVGRPELVGTDSEYRRRGLVRAQFDEIHRWGDERGHLMQVITGIPWYYRLFGYEMALDLEDGRLCTAADIPELKKSEQEAFRLRPAAETDIPFLVSTHEHAAKRSLVVEKRDEALWRYELEGRSEGSMQKCRVRILERREGESLGLVVYPPVLWNGRAHVKMVELKEGASWLEAGAPLLRLLKTEAERLPSFDSKPFVGIQLFAASEHPLYEALPKTFGPRSRMYAYYVRVPDVAAFLQRIAPALERRLAGSIAPGHSGELELDFYRSGVRIFFEKGRIAQIERVERFSDEGKSSWRVCFPDLTFLKVLFGYKSYDELREAFPDCGGAQGGEALVRILFPKKSSLPIAIA